MDAIQTILNDFKNKKIDDSQLQDQLAALLTPNITSQESLDQQVTQLKENYSLPPETFDGVKTIVASSFFANDNDRTVVSGGDATRVFTDKDHTIVQPTQNNVKTLVGVETKGTLSEHTNNYLDITHATSKASSLKTGSVLKNRFILEQELGHGGMSIVYRALDLRKQEANNRNPYIAVKILGAAFKNHPQSIRVLEHETQKIQSLAHPNIITVYDFDRDADAIYMTMECLEGESLDALIKKNESGLAIEKALPIIEGMSRALAYAHSKNIIHSDLKPENVYITTENVVKVLDFGIARAKKLPEQKGNSSAKAHVDFDGSNLGALTPPYASAEMFEEADPDQRDDIYALGCVTYKLLTGTHPFNNRQANHARDSRMVPKKITELSRKQWTTLNKSLAFEREQRISNIPEFLNGMVPKKRSVWFYAGLFGTCLALFISAYSWYSASQKPILLQVKLTIEQKQKITTYLETADIYLSMGYLALPPGDSAYDQFQKILAIDPTNQVAIEGNKKIASQYVVFAQEKFSSNQLEESLQLINTGLLVQPDNKKLLDLKQKIQRLKAPS